MSQPAGTERTPSARGAAGGGNLLTRRYGGVPGWGWVAVVSLLAAGVIWYVQRRRSRSAAAPAAGAAGPTQATCYDANGNTVACSDPAAVGSNATDYFEALYAQSQGINSQLENIGPQVTETGMDVDALERLLRELQGEESTEDGSRTGPGTVRNLQVEAETPTVARVSWQAPAVGTARAPAPGQPPIAVAAARRAYTIEIQGKDKGPHNIGLRTSYTATGLKPGGHYTAVVAPVGGPSASKAFTMPRRGERPREIPGGPDVPVGRPGVA